MGGPSLFPVFSVDPNGPWHVVEGIICLVVRVDDPDLQADLKSGEIEVGNTVILFQPNERSGYSQTEEGWGSIGRLMEISFRNDPVHYVVYLDVDPK